jgi:prevent-host-death family protein
MSHTKIGAMDTVVEETGELVPLVDQVAKGQTRIVVTRDGEPKAALVSLADYARLMQESQAEKWGNKLGRDEWLVKSRELQESILERRGGKPLDPEVVDQAWRDARTELEERDSRNAGLGR